MNVFICFDDTRDAGLSFEQIQTVNTTWNAVYISQTEYASAKSIGTQELTSFHDGQVIFAARFKGLTSEFGVNGLIDAVQHLAGQFGDVLAFAEMDSEAGYWSFRVEYYKISVANHVIATLTAASPRSVGVSYLDSPHVKSC